VSLISDFRNHTPLFPKPNPPLQPRRIGFAELVPLIEQRALELEQATHDVTEIRVIALDFRYPGCDEKGSRGGSRAVD
jgi:hypothetical protein